MKKYGKLYGMALLAFLFQACGETGLPDPNPKPSPGIDFTININQSPYTSLLKTGGAALVIQQKVIVARLDATNWAALSGYCPNDQTVALTYNPTDFTFRCSKDNSVFDYQGKTKSGSSPNLTRYNTTFTNNTGILRIFE